MGKLYFCDYVYDTHAHSQHIVGVHLKRLTPSRGLDLKTNLLLQKTMLISYNYD